MCVAQCELIGYGVSPLFLLDRFIHMVLGKN